MHDLGIAKFEYNGGGVYCFCLVYNQTLLRLRNLAFRIFFAQCTMYSITLRETPLEYPVGYKMLTFLRSRLAK